jgi:single-stranded DNA-binding protein
MVLIGVKYMLNQVIIVGKLKKVEKIDNQYYLILEVEKDFRENDGILKVEKIKCGVWRGIADSIEDYYQPGQYLMIVGRLENINQELVVIGEKINFSTKFSKGVSQ